MSANRGYEADLLIARRRPWTTGQGVAEPMVQRSHSPREQRNAAADRRLTQPAAPAGDGCQ